MPPAEKCRYRSGFGPHGECRSMKPEDQSQIDEALIVPLHDDDRPSRMRERAQALELTPYNPAPSRPAWRDARDMKTCPLWVAALIAVGVGGGALLAFAGAGWLIWESSLWIGGVL